MKTLAIIIIAALINGCGAQRSYNRTVASNQLTALCKAGDVRACEVLTTTPAIGGAIIRTQ